MYTWDKLWLINKYEVAIQLLLNEVLGKIYHSYMNLLCEWDSYQHQIGINNIITNDSTWFIYMTKLFPV